MNVANLDVNLRYAILQFKYSNLTYLQCRYRPENLLLCGLTPGPHELTADELQLFMAAFVDDLLMLYDRGIIVKTPAFPDGAPVAILCLESLILFQYRTPRAADSNRSLLRSPCALPRMWLWGPFHEDLLLHKVHLSTP